MGNRNVSRSALLEVFSPDRGRSVLQVPLAERRRQMEAIPWVEQATVRRVLPDSMQVEILERTPIAFLRNGSDLALVDSHGVILDRPLQGKFHFPVVTGITLDIPVAERERRMQLFTGFLQQLDSARVGAVEEVSEVDLADARDLRASLSGLQTGGAAARLGAGNSTESVGEPDAPILVHFGDGNFREKYETLLDKMGQWRATAGEIESVDLRFEGEAVVNSLAPPLARLQKQAPPRKRRGKHGDAHAKRPD